MNKTFAILSYPNSNNLGDFIQSEAVKQYLKDKIVKQIDREQLHSYDGTKVQMFMNGWFMENPNNWPPSKKINPFFFIVSFESYIKKKDAFPKRSQFFKKAPTYWLQGYLHSKNFI